MAVLTTDVLAPRVGEALMRLERHCRAADYAGSDPYDGLLTPLSRFAWSKPIRQVIVQGVKRGPVNLRTLLRIPPVRMSKSLALFAHGYAMTSDTSPGYLHHAERLVSDLIAAQGSAGAWGYEFDVQTRWGFYPAGSPNMVATAFALEALDPFTTPEVVAAAARDWLTSEMWHPSGYFRYVPDNDTLVHNANLLGARAMARVSSTAEDSELVRTAVQTTMQALPSTGFWPYGAATNLTWVDSFHTCYVLDCLTDLQDIAMPHTAETATLVRRWFDTFVQSDGYIAYYADGDGPIDIHNLASGVDLIARYWTALPAKRRDQAVERLLSFQRSDGAFAVGSQPAYMRWNNAHAFRALARVAQVLR